MRVFYFIMAKKNNLLIFDDNASIEVFGNEKVGDCFIEMYFNNHKDDYIIMSLQKDDVQNLIDQLLEIYKSM